MKKLRIIPLILVIPLLFSSCLASETELKNRLIIEGVGIDFDEEKEEYILTVQAFATSQKGGKENAAQNPVVNYTATGKSVAQALADLSDTTGKKALYSQNLVIVTGKSVTGDKIISSIDFFAREYTARADVYVAAATGDASEILKIPEEGSEIPAKIIEESIYESIKDSISVNTELFNVVNLYLEETTSFTIPLLEIKKDKNGGEQTVKVTGTYIYNKDSDTNHLSPEETMFFLLLTNKAEKGTFSLESDGITVGLDIVKASSRIKTDMKDGVPSFDIKIKCSVNMVEYDTSDFGDFTAEDIKKIEESAGKYIANGLKNLLDRELKERKADIFRFGRRFMQKFPEEYEKTEKEWAQMLPEIKTDIRVQVNLRRIGQETIKNS